MPVEIELKAWAANPKATRSRLSGAGRFLGGFTKEDRYWRFGPRDAPDARPDIRVRRERDAAGERLLVTFKRKEIREGIEVNGEHEFRVDATPEGTEALEGLLRLFGLDPWLRKRKTGAAWDCGGVRAELHEVEGLGHFLELEILADSGGEETVRAARARLLSLLETCGIGAENIESRPYTELLEKMARKNGGL